MSDAKSETTFALSSTGKPRNSARSANANPIVAVPIASASVKTINPDVPGLRAIMRAAVRRSLVKSINIGDLLGPERGMRAGWVK